MTISNHPVTQSPGQQSSPTLDPETQTFLRLHLVLLLHAQKCQRSENQSNGEVTQCSITNCQFMKQLLSHLTTCQEGESCDVLHCSSSRLLLSHWPLMTLMTNHLVTQCPWQQSSPTLDLEKQTLTQIQLIFLLHALKCPRPENQSNGEVRQCTFPDCRIMKRALSHITTCQAGESCDFLHCSISRQILSHWTNCACIGCPVCVPIKQISDRRQQQAAAAVQTRHSSQGPSASDMRQAYADFCLKLAMANINPVIQRSQPVSVPHGFKRRNSVTDFEAVLPFKKRKIYTFETELHL